MEPRNISTQVNYSLRPHVYWLNTFGHLSKKKEEEEKNNSTEMPGLWFTSPNILITREDSKVKPSTRILIEGSQEKGSATSSQVNIIFHFFPRYFTDDFFFHSLNNGVFMLLLTVNRFVDPCIKGWNIGWNTAEFWFIGTGFENLIWFFFGGCGGWVIRVYTNYM